MAAGIISLAERTQTGLRKTGVEFIDENGGGPLALRNPQKD
jgi:hypothetical protein